MRSPTAYLDNLRTGKPDVGHRDRLDDRINSLRSAKRRIEHQMTALAHVLKERESPHFKLNERYEELNRELFETKIKEAEKVYMRNLL